MERTGASRRNGRREPGSGVQQQVDRARAARTAAVVPVLVALLTLPACAARSVESAAWDHVHATVDREPLHRWPAGTELVVDVSALSDRDAMAVIEAFEAWLPSTRAPVRVRVAGPDDTANVVFHDAGEIDEGYETLGLTRLAWDGPWLVGAEVELAHSSRCGSFLSSTERRRAVLHEVGHVLGLGHSPRLSSIMHRNTPGTSVDERDRLALTYLYTLGPTPARVAVTAAAPDTK